MAGYLMPPPLPTNPLLVFFFPFSQPKFRLPVGLDSTRSAVVSTFSSSKLWSLQEFVISEFCALRYIYPIPTHKANGKSVLSMESLV
ncbi:hypothetical protein AKJ16_DCAP08035 [Drosera capensis]